MASMPGFVRAGHSLPFSADWSQGFQFTQRRGLVDRRTSPQRRLRGHRFGSIQGAHFALHGRDVCPQCSAMAAKVLESFVSKAKVARH